MFISFIIYCVWTEPSMGTDLAQEPILESAQENQDSDFRDELHVSDTPHPLFPTVPWSNSATSLQVGCSQDWRTRGRSRITLRQSGTEPLTKVEHYCIAQGRGGCEQHYKE